ncbi:transcription termination/antitermination protein NusG [Sinisalibacter lacisalsi]|uniref:Transcription antitermination protein RfaH n=1 Tax=Sinisalibacter lacisalsi TaxID=1526570 RepID=A0ABQ1QKW9_9RHOB|nr:transcriptional activator RfaH [Sinisalibacter lacisalsi]GGD29935.1 transcription antitermination protein RfaH [Sinisalibacter lacisalsi]
MTSSPDDKSWYLAQVKPNGFRIAERNLARQGFETFVPLVDQTRRGRGGFVTRQALLFPGYLFVAFDPAAAGWRAVMSTHGISRLVSTGDTPTAVPPDLVEAIRARCRPDGVLGAPEDLPQGAAVRITTGPFAEFVARVEQMAPDQRVWVLIELMGRKTRIAVPRDGVRPL